MSSRCYFGSILEHVLVRANKLSVYSVCVFFVWSVYVSLMRLQLHVSFSVFSCRRLRPVRQMRWMRGRPSSNQLRSLPPRAWCWCPDWTTPRCSGYDMHKHTHTHIYDCLGHANRDQGSDVSFLVKCYRTLWRL